MSGNKYAPEMTFSARIQNCILFHSKSSISLYHMTPPRGRHSHRLAARVAVGASGGGAASPVFTCRARARWAGIGSACGGAAGLGGATDAPITVQPLGDGAGRHGAGGGVTIRVVMGGVKGLLGIGGGARSHNNNSNNYTSSDVISD